jgi:hypothetical protein
MAILHRRFVPLVAFAGVAAVGLFGAQAFETEEASVPEVHAAPVEVRALPPLPSRDSLAKLLVSPTSTVERGETAMLLDIIDASERIGSSGQRAAVLMEITEMRALDSSVVSAVARASTRISSSSGRGHALRMLIRRHADATGASHRAVLDAVATMMSDSERAETLEMFVRRPRLSESALTAALTQAGRMRDGDDRSRVLIAAARANRINGGARAAYVRAAAGISSERQRSRVLAAIERGGR